MKKIPIYFSVTRPINSLITGLAIVFSILVYSDWSIDYSKLIIGFTTGYAGSAAAMCINDYVDVNVDSINKPWKPLPRGLISRSKVLYMSIAFLVTAVLINIFNSGLLLVALLYGTMSYTYSFLKKHWWRQLIVCLSTTAPIVYGYVASHTPAKYFYFTVFFALTMFSATLSREIVKALMDIIGDWENNYSTIPLRLGLDNTWRIKTLLYINSIVTVTTGLVAGRVLEHVSIPYFVLITIASSVYTYYLLKTTSSISSRYLNWILLEKTRRNTLAAMFIGLIAFFTIGL